MMGKILGISGDDDDDYERVGPQERGFFPDEV
jgi:hypothetical protein